MEHEKNPLIGATSLETVQNVTDAFNELMVMLSHKNSGLATLMSPLLHALEHMSDAADGTMPLEIPQPPVRSVPCTSQCQT